MEVNKKMEDRIISRKEAMEILSLSSARVSQLLGQGRIGTREMGISYAKTIAFRDARKPGRPEGSYKKS